VSELRTKESRKCVEHFSPVVRPPVSWSSKRPIDGVLPRVHEQADAVAFSPSGAEIIGAVLPPFLIGWRKSGCAKETPSGGEGIQAGPQPTGRQNHPLGWLASGSEEVESAIYGQSLLASGLRQARRKEVIERSNPRSTHGACCYLVRKQPTGTDGFRVLCHQFITSSFPLLGNCIKRCSTCLLRRKELREALLLL